RNHPRRPASYSRRTPPRLGNAQAQGERRENAGRAHGGAAFQPPRSNDSALGGWKAAAPATTPHSAAGKPPLLGRLSSRPLTKLTPAAVEGRLSSRPGATTPRSAAVGGWKAAAPSRRGDAPGTSAG